MSLNNLNYDKCAEKQYFQDSIKPGLYIINPPVIVTPCFQTNPEIINQKGGDSMNANTDWRFFAGPVDVESDLFNIDRRASKCPKYKYQPKCPNCQVITSGQPCGDGVSLSCHFCGIKLPKGAMCNQNLINLPECYLPTDQTRLSNPVQSLKSIGFDRWEQPLFNPQETIYEPKTRNEIDTRNIYRDRHQMRKRQFNINSLHPKDLGLVDQNIKMGIEDPQYLFSQFHIKNMLKLNEQARQQKQN